ncbi:MAG: divalent-cation tolerance protein CutA [Candidatus Omnitrophica bacterium]|nr:divalent-cation tolerance protein CutA [Candidatus Omnitrophota bacterium]MDD4012878.1 divalent-cation tolerance protein CutA [Candidatus Omnitrophota bacterium]
MNELSMVYITVPDLAEAERIAGYLVERRLAACVNIFDNVKSVYRWKGNVERSTEAVLIAKTREGLSEQLLETVKSIHSYACPCIEVIKVTNAHKGYLEWVMSETI